MNAETGIVLLYFAGAIAFVPELPEPGPVNAFLVKIDQHYQLLRVPLDSLKSRECHAYCKVDKTNNFCDCDLKDNIIISIPNQEKSTGVLPDKPPDKLKDETVDKIDWLVSMWHVKPRAGRFTKDAIPLYVGGQISFNWTEAATCLFEEALCDNDNTRRIFSVKFEVAWSGNRIQPVPELVVFKSKNKSKDVMIKLMQRESQQTVATLELDCPNAEPCPVIISNSMKPKNNSGDLCDPKKCGESKVEGEHFREYRRLTNDKFGVAPNRMCNVKVDFPNSEPPELCKPFYNLPGFLPRAVSNRVICPPASLEP